MLSSIIVFRIEGLIVSRISQVIKNKNRREKADRLRKRQKMAAMQLEAAYRSRLNDDMRQIKTLFEDEEVDTVRIEVPEKLLSQFLKAIYAEEMAEYSISQVGVNTFDIGRKMVNF